jgi:hypothetical protein
MKKFNPAKRVLSQAVVWQRGTDGSWDKHLVREQEHEAPLVTRLISVPVGVPVCFVCLSTDVSVVVSSKYSLGEMHCHKCRAQYGIIV